MPSMGLMLVLVAFVSAYSARRLTALADRGEMLETWRHMVVANLQWARRMQWATAAIVAFLLYKALTGGRGAPSTPRSTTAASPFPWPRPGSTSGA